MNDIRFSELANFQDKQNVALQTLFNPECKYLLYGGAGGGGKSYFLRWAALCLILYYTQKYNIRGVQVGLFSEDYPTLKDRQISKIKREFPPWLGGLQDRRDEGYVFQVAEDYGGGQMLLRNLDDPSKYASSEFAGEFVEELTKNSKDTFDDLRFRMRWPGISDVKFVGATNPGQKGHVWVRGLWVRKDPKIIDKERERFFYVPASVYDNKFIDAEYVKQLESLPEKKRAMLLEGSWDKPEGQVFEEWSETYHTIKPLLPSNKHTHIMHMDWGYSEKSAFSCHLSAIIRQVTTDGQNFNRVITYKEFYGNQKAPDVWAEEIFKYCRKNGIRNIEFGYTDPAMHNTQTDGSRSISKMFMEKWEALNGGAHWVKLKRGSNNRIEGAATVHNWLKLAPDGMPYWMVTKNCEALISTIPDLVYDDNRDDDVDTDQVDHAYDDARYGLSQIKWIEVKSGQLLPGLIQTVRLPIDAQGRQVGFDLKDLFEEEADTKDWQSI